MNIESKHQIELRPILLQRRAPYSSRAQDPVAQADKIRARVNSFLYSKYSSSLTYYYLRDVNDIIAGNRTPTVIRFVDDVCFDDRDRLLKRYYRITEYPLKITLLTECYRLHDELPRFFIMQFELVVFIFYDKMRRINYIRFA